MKSLFVLVAVAVIASCGSVFAEKVTLDSRGILQVEGKPYFPVGMYTLQDRAGKDHDAILKEAREAGFNTTVFYAWTVETVTPLLDAAARQGMRALVYPTLPFSLRKTELTREEQMADIKARMNHPALLGWYLVDEPEGIGKAKPEPVRELNRLVKELDSNHPTALVIMNPKPAAGYFGCADIIWTDPYPMPKWSVNVVKQWVGDAVAIAGPDKPVWAILQAHDLNVWGTGKIVDEHRPTDAEERCMTYLALTHGAKGIIYWAHTASRYYIRDYPEHWEYVKKLAGEIRDLSPVLLTTTLPAPAFEPSDAPVSTMMKVYDGSLYLIVVNRDKAAHKITFRLPKAAQPKAEVLFEKRSISAKDGVLSDDFAPLEVHVYKMAVK